MTIKFLAPILVTIFLGAGCSTAIDQKTPDPLQPGQKTEEQAKTTTPSCGPEGCENMMGTDDHASDGEHIAKLAGSRVDLKNKNSLKPGETELAFKLFGEDGHAFGPSDLKIEHEKKMHLLLVRDDMTRFQHLHPEFVNDLWIVKAVIADQGVYQMYVDIAPVEEEASVLRVPITIGGGTQNGKAPEPNTDWSAQDGEYMAKLMIDQPLKTKEVKQWTFIVTQSGKPVTNLKPYLGAYGHVVELRHTDADDFFHVHPVTEDQPKDGKVVFEGTFPSKGRYTLYAQFNINGSIKTFPITVDVNEDGQATPATNSQGQDNGGH